MKNEEYIDINKIAELKGLKSNRSLRLAIQKGKYIAREVKVFGGKSYEILYSSLEPEIQEKFQDELIKEATQSNCTALVPINNINNKNFITESAKLTALARVDIVKALQNMRAKYKTKKEADSIFLDLYNSGMYLPKIHKFIGSISIGTLHRWITSDDDFRIGSFISVIDMIIAETPTKQGVLIVRRNRDVSKGTGAMLSPNDWKLGASITDKVVLTMYKMTGEKGWNNQKLWVPNIKLPENIIYYDIVDAKEEE